jgi:multiple antibiotic resistance protein
MLPWPEYPHFAASLLAILTPFAAVPAYLSLTQGFTNWERSHSAVLAAGTAAAVLIIAALIARGLRGVVAGWRRCGAPTDGALDVEPR